MAPLQRRNQTNRVVGTTAAAAAPPSPPSASKQSTEIWRLRQNPNTWVKSTDEQEELAQSGKDPLLVATNGFACITTCRIWVRV